MNLKNGYKVMYEVIEGSERVFSASKTGLFADADEITRFEIGSYKVVYQRGEEFFGINAEGVETKLDAFDAIFIEATEENTTEDPTPDPDPIPDPDPSTGSENTQEPKEDEGENIPGKGTEEV